MGWGDVLLCVAGGLIEAALLRLRRRIRARADEIRSEVDAWDVPPGRSPRWVNEIRKGQRP